MAKKESLENIKERTQDLGSELIYEMEEIIDLLKKTGRDRFNFRAAQQARVQSIELSQRFKLWRKLSMHYTNMYRDQL